MRDVLVLDGSQGEGGGQILRTALSLSLVRGQAFRLVNIRTGRRNPGLLPQHLAALRAAADWRRYSIRGPSGFDRDRLRSHATAAARGLCLRCGRDGQSRQRRLRHFDLADIIAFPWRSPTAIPP